MSISLKFHGIHSFCEMKFSRSFTDKEFICGTASKIHGREVCRSREDGGDHTFPRGSFGAYVEKIRRMRCNFVEPPAFSFCS
jgi:hypothetical protein